MAVARDRGVVTGRDRGADRSAWAATGRTGEGGEGMTMAAVRTRGTW